MPDDRLFHKTIGHSEKVNKITDFEDLAWRSYVLAADDFGIMRFSALTLQADNDRMASKPQRTVQRALDAVVNVGLIKTFDHQGRTYCYQHDWQDWQKITYPKRTVHPPLPPEHLIQCTDNTRWLMTVFPGGRKLQTWQCPESFKTPSGIYPESFRSPESLTRGRALTLAKTNGNGFDSSEPFESFAPELPPESLDRRAGEFVERYGDLHRKYRNGATYVAKPSVDFLEARLLVASYPDDDRLDKLARIWFQADDAFAESGTRTMAKFRSRVSWCEEQLIAFEQKQAVRR